MRSQRCNEIWKTLGSVKIWWPGVGPHSGILVITVSADFPIVLRREHSDQGRMESFANCSLAADPCGSIANAAWKGWSDMDQSSALPSQQNDRRKPIYRAFKRFKLLNRAWWSQIIWLNFFVSQFQIRLKMNLYVALCNSGQYFTKQNVFLRVILNKQTAKFIQKYFSSNCINIALMHSAQSAFPS